MERLVYLPLSLLGRGKSTLPPHVQILHEKRYVLYDNIWL